MTKSSALKFSKFRPNELQEVCRLLSSVFQTSPDKLTELYVQLDSTLEDAGWPPHFVSRDFFCTRDGHFQSVYEQSPAIAVDLPSLLELSDGVQEKPTIVLLGQDPKSNQSYDRISLGTPYGLHHKGSREQLTNTKLYFKMIQVLMELGYRVYLTDIFKVWICNPQRLYSGMTLPKADRDKFLDILEAELDIMNPTAVVTWGKPSARSIKDLEVDLHLEFPHPSGAANKAWKELLGGQSPTHANKLAYWESSVNQVLCHRSA